MQTDPRLVEALIARHRDEIKASIQYDVHAAQMENAGLVKLAAHRREHAADERRHQALLAARIALFGCIPSVDPMDDVIGGESDFAIMISDERVLEGQARSDYNELIALCVELRDNDTRALIESILKDETHHAHDAEQDIDLLNLLGSQNFYAAQVG